MYLPPILYSVMRKRIRSHLAEGGPRPVAKSLVQVMRYLHCCPDQLLIHQLQLRIEGERMPVYDSLSYRILNLLQATML